ncbi:hypothetical protein [Bacillus thuringiensis]|nr:hypothetical protein [Bacillus thuringiensis]
MAKTESSANGRTEEEIRQEIEREISDRDALKLFGERSKIAITARDIVG